MDGCIDEGLMYMGGGSKTRHRARAHPLLSPSTNISFRFHGARSTERERAGDRERGIFDVNTAQALRNVAVVSLANCNCRRTRITALTTKWPSKLLHASAAPPPPSSSTSSSRERFFSSDDVSSSTAFSSKSTNTSRTVSGCRSDSRALPRRIEGGVAVVKTSDDPYHDFRNSMVQMIVENEIYGRDGLWELFRCLLSLNSAHHHEVILRAFADVVDGLFP